MEREREREESERELEKNKDRCLQKCKVCILIIFFMQNLEILADSNCCIAKNV